MLRKLLLCTALLSPSFLQATEQLHFQGVDEPTVEESEEQPLTEAEKAEAMLQQIEFITDRGSYDEYPYVLTIVDATKIQHGAAVSQVFARPTFLREDASTDGKGIWLSSDLSKYAYNFSAKEQKLIKERMARDPEFRKWFDDHTNALIEHCGIQCRLEWKDSRLVAEEVQGVVDEPLRDAGGNISFDNSRADRRILSFDMGEISLAVEDRPTVYSDDDAKAWSKGFRVSAFATPATMGEYAESWDDISSGLQLTYGMIGQWNDKSGTVLVYDGKKLARFPDIPELTYATVADGVVTIPETATYEFKWDNFGIGDQDVAVLINDKVILGGPVDLEYMPVRLEAGDYPIKIYAYNPSPEWGLTGFPVCKGSDEDLGFLRVGERLRARAPAGKGAHTVSPLSQLTTGKHQSVTTVYGSTPSEVVFTTHENLTDEVSEIVTAAIGGTRGGGEMRCATSWANAIAPYDGAPTTHRNFGIVFKNTKNAVKVRGGNIGVLFRNAEEQSRWARLALYVRSPRVKTQDEGVRYSKPIGEITYKAYKPFTKTRMLNEKNGMVSLDRGGYTENPDVRESNDGRMDYLPTRTLLEYEWTYDAKTAGTHFIAPLFSPLTVYVDPQSNYDHVIYKSAHANWDTINLNVTPSCRYSVLAYDEDISGYKSITAALNGDYMLSTSKYNSDYLTRLDVVEPRPIKIKGTIVCDEPFTLDWLTKSPTDLRFRNWREE